MHTINGRSGIPSDSLPKSADQNCEKRVSSETLRIHAAQWAAQRIANSSAREME